MALQYKEIEAGAEMAWSDTWDKTDKEGNIVKEGKYQAEISIIIMNTGEVDTEDFNTIIEFEL
ncbi:hypothetical protein F8153_08225 [Alkaliphilus serpentinus]|uniref:FlgD Ig-like domain-containing protein n=1 Tax=Alkaliphilus serpentinus TaxID=1482731 RepID=A0A833HNW6_9FIRM|nr:hypothetical protein [Alkaliphilus serpentinus]KAB3530065.1 hypothetical protein F8153_08225 [Alkaliphilus serpentinus]